MQDSTQSPEYVETLIIGAGQAGLSTGYHLKQRGRPFLILEARDRIGDSWRERWDSLRLFTPARYDGLDGMPFPASPHYHPTKDEMASYLEQYARRFALPVWTGVRVDRVSRRGGRYLVESGERRFEADNVVVAMSDYQHARLPAFASALDPDIVRLHSSAYRNTAQLREGPVLLVGAGNSGSEIALELSKRHRVYMSGRDTGHLPFRIAGLAGRLFMVRLVLRVLFYRVLTVDTPIGRRVRSKVLHKGGPLIRVMPADLERAGVQRVAKTVGVRDGRPLLEDGSVLDVANVIWCCGYHSGFDWIDLPVLDADGPVHRAGIVEHGPRFYFGGLHVLHAMSSSMIQGVGRDARRIAAHIAARGEARPPRPNADAARRLAHATPA